MRDVASGPACTPEVCAGIHCVFTRFDGEDPGFAVAFSDMAEVLTQITGASASSPPPGDGMPTNRVVLAVGGGFRSHETVTEHFQRCFTYAQHTVRALRLAVNAPVPNLTIERVWPMYLVLREDRLGTFEVSNVVVVEHGFAKSGEVTAEVLQRASAALAASYNQNPVAAYRDFELGAQNAARVEGDYPGAILKAATAAEILLRHCAWMLTWEATEELESDPEPDLVRSDLFSVRPSTLIGTVLSGRLGGSWDSRDEVKPIGAWRHHIARPRNDVIHRGHHPTEAEVRAAVQALDQLAKRVLDGVAERAAIYPRSAMLLVGPLGLDRRDVRHLVSQPAGDSRNLNQLAMSYRRWLDGRLPNGDD